MENTSLQLRHARFGFAFAKTISSTGAKASALINKIITILKTLTMSKILGLTFVIVFFKILIAIKKARKYRNHDPNDPVELTHRPNRQYPPPRMIVPMTPGVTPFPANHLSYPAENQESAKENLDNLNRLRDGLGLVGFEACPQHHTTYASCGCRLIDNARQTKMLGLYEIERSLQELTSPSPCPAFTIGDSFKLSIRHGAIYTLAEYFGCEMDLRMRVVDCFRVGDTRPHNERHVQLSNSTYYVIRVERLTVRSPGLFKKQLPDACRHSFGIPQRDLFVSEELIRHTRRGQLTGEFEKSLASYLENSLSVPINDPIFLRMRANPIKDSFYVCRGVVAGVIPPKWDF